jgi:predicted phage replisome organizer
MVQVQWIKIYTDIFDNEKMKKILRGRDGDTYFRVWVQLLTLAAKSNMGGAIMLGENIPMTVQDIADTMNKTADKLRTIMDKLCTLDMIVVNDDVISIKNWDVYQSVTELEKIRENQRKRTQKFRDKQKKCNVTETLGNTEEKNRKEENINIKEGTQENESGFKN